MARDNYNKTVEIIENEGNMIAIIILNSFNKPGISFFSPNNFILQVGSLCHPKGHKIKPHVHNDVQRITNGTQEVLIIKKGLIKIDLFSLKHKYLCSRELSSGDIILLASGGHAITVLEPTSIMEVKNGPYDPNSDKARIIESEV